MRLSAHAQNHKSCEYVPKSTTMIVNIKKQKVRHISTSGLFGLLT